MAFKPGERVKYLNESGGGKVIRLLPGDLVEIEDDEGFIYAMKPSELVSPERSVLDERAIAEKLVSFSSRVSANQPGKSHDHDYHMLVREYLMSSKSQWTSRDKDFIEIDLHIEELSPMPGKLSDGEKLLLQVSHARLCLEAAIDMRISRIIYIHGVGAGVLKAELRKWLKTFSHLDIHDASYKRYGMGATEVVVRGYHG